MPYYPPGREEPKKNEPPRKHSAATWILLAVSILLVLYGSFRLISYVTDLHASQRTTQELREAAQEAEEKAEEGQEGQPAESIERASAETSPKAPDEEPNVSAAESVPADASAGSAKEADQETALSASLPEVPYPKGYALVSRIRELRKKSGDIIGWIKMDDLDEPVVLRDNSFFLNHDAMGRKNVNGAIFMDEDTSLLTRPYTILLYGHNMKTGAMFGNLRKYETFSYCYKHRMIQFDTLYEEGQYVIFAVETVSVTPGRGKYLNLTALQSTERAVRKGAIRKLMDYSLYQTILDVNEEDPLLLLITCVGDEDERLIVAARRLRDGETADTLPVSSDHVQKHDEKPEKI